MKTKIAEEHDPHIRQDQLEVKANFLTKPNARKDSPFFKHLTDDEINHISTNYIDQLDKSNMVVIASVIDKGKLNEATTTKEMHGNAYEMLLERIQHYMLNNHHKHNALIIMDDTGANLNREISLMHAGFLGHGNNNMKFKNIIEYPFFVSSELSNGVQLADLVAYTIYHCFKNKRPNSPYLKRVSPHISRLPSDNNKLAGLKIWPKSARFNTIYMAVEQNLKRR